MSTGLPRPTIVMTPPTQSATQRRAELHPHPRRPPASQSVSLLHSPRKRLQQVRGGSDSSSSNSNNAVSSTSSKPALPLVRHSPSSLQPLTGKGSSGESSNADRWFEQSNNEPRENSTAFTDNDPPFFMRNSSSSETPPNGYFSAQRLFAGDPANSLPLRAGLLQLGGTDGSSTEDFRSVIDDLTVQNKKLKRRLKKYEKLHDSHLKHEKLFEVRVHGLPPDKKHELEETLRKFASGLSTRTGSEFPSNGYEGLAPILQTHKTASSSTSNLNTDSAYASMSASGQGSSSAHSRSKPFAQLANSRHQNIHSYLHHIPEGLLPQENPATMSEKAKKKLVVRRLEQIFAGKGAATGGHQQALQQQDVSQMAARADTVAKEADGQRTGQEGIREATIMQKTTEDPADPSTRPLDGDSSPDVDVATTTTPDPQMQKLAERRGIGKSPAHHEQRPTRPLDLDPHRAQVPAENLRYFRHLGFTMSEDDDQLSQDDQGWIYLNLLVNLAQLHTINVTADFVRKAVTDYSEKFELSSDGRKLRWKGGSCVTRTSSHGGNSSIDRTGDECQSPRKRPRLASKESARRSTRAAQHLRGACAHGARTENSRFSYTPLFFRRDSSGDDESSSEPEEEEDDDDSPFPPVNAGDSSGITSSGIRTTSHKYKPKHEDGPIIFYNNARFCTDLSGDRRPQGNQGAPVYKAASNVPVGRPQPTSTEVDVEKRGPLAEAAELPEPLDFADNPIPEWMELKFPSPSPSGTNQSPDATPIDLAVTGIGNVYPADNFAISVQNRRALINQSEMPDHIAAQGSSKNLPPKLAHLLSGEGSSRKIRPMVKEEVIKQQRTDLKPSTLPPALSFMPFENDSMSDDGSAADEQMSESPGSPDALPRLAAPQQMDIHIDDSDMDCDEEDDEDNDSEDSDSSLDLLAAARMVDPEAVKAKEREYDANMAERLAEDIPAGSSAATAGGGSGFASPESNVSKLAYQKAKIEARARPPLMQPARTSDSMVVGAQGSSSSSDNGGERMVT